MADVDDMDLYLDWEIVPSRSSLLRKLPLVLEAASENLTHLNITIPPLHLTVLDADLPNIRRTCQKLKFVQIIISQRTRWERTRPSLVNWTRPQSYLLIDALLVSPRLEAVKLHIRPRNGGGGYDGALSIGSVLANLSWENLRSFCLSEFPIKVAELQQVLGKMTGKIHLDLDGVYLQEGTWAQALEILRGRADPSSRVINPRGVEMMQMSKQTAGRFRSRFEMLGRGGWYTSHKYLGPASFYIRGLDIPNPLIVSDVALTSW